MYKSIFKRFLDFGLAVAILFFLSPLIIFLLILLSVSNCGNPFFVQKRPGMNEVPFFVIKFRTMNNKTDKYGNLLPDNERITRLGRFVRKTSLDELPQLINVLKGDMSFIGPRPLLIEYLPLYTIEQKRRHTVRPGITGWAQVNGRNSISWKEKFDLDLWYVNNISLKLDIRILLLTIYKVAKQDGINRSKFITMEKFNGRN